MNEHKPPKQFVKMKAGDFGHTYEIMREALIRDGEYAVYKDGWDDERVAKILQANPKTAYVHASMVGHFRRRAFGNFPPRVKKELLASPDGTKARLTRLEADMQSVMDFLTNRAGYKARAAYGPLNNSED
jgi:hypothetical protein